MDRRSILTLLGASTALVACQQESSTEASKNTNPEVNWRLITSWPKNFPGIGQAPEDMAKMVSEMTNGKFNIKVYGAGEVAPALGVFDNVSSGAAHMGHSAAYYWKGKLAAAPFFTGIPFGMNAREMHAWMQDGGGQELWDELYAPFNLKPLPGGNTGVQMGGWFNKPINSVEDLKGMKMRIPGIAGEIWNKAGGTSVMLPGGEIFQALEKGTIDATEWLGPANDLAFGLPQIAKYYYMPGWHEPGSMLEFTINKKALESLPKNYQAILKTACIAASEKMLSFYTAANATALNTIKENKNVEIREFPEDVLKKLYAMSKDVIDEMVQSDATIAKVYQSYSDFQKSVQQYHRISEEAYYNIRTLVE